MVFPNENFASRQGTMSKQTKVGYKHGHQL